LASGTVFPDPAVTLAAVKRLFKVNVEWAARVVIHVESSLIDLPEEDMLIRTARYSNRLEHPVQ
jgi:hypothetical protein